MNAFLWAATVLLAALGPLLVACSLARPIDGLVVLQAAGAVSVLALLCLSAGLGESFLFDIPVIAVVASWIGCFTFARFLGRRT